MSYAYVGCRTTRERNARGKGIGVYSVDDTGKWAPVQLLEGLENPSFLCFDAEKKFLYCVHGDGFSVSSFRIDSKNGTIEKLNTIRSVGKNPVFLTADRTNRYLYVASLQGGAVSTLRRNGDGSLTDPIFTAKLEGLTEGSVSCAHQCLLSPSGEYLFVPTQGRGKGYGGVFVFRTMEDGSLVRTQRFEARAKDEPRHLVVHGNGRWEYVLNEKGNCVTFSEFSPSAGTMQAKQIVSTLPETYVGDSQAGELVISTDFRFLYASNRTHDSIAQFSIDEQTGSIRCIGWTPCLGKIPRFMGLDPSGHRLAVANEESDTIRIFELDPLSGTPVFSGITIPSESPVCIVFKD